MAEPLMFDMRVVSAILASLGGIILLLKKIGLTFSWGVKKVEAAPAAGRFSLSSSETIQSLEKKQDITLCKLRVAGFKEDLSAIKEEQIQQRQILIAIAGKMDISIRGGNIK